MKRQIVVWACHDCPYWRKEQSTGVHMTPNPDDPNGKYVRHTLHEDVYEEAESSALNGLVACHKVAARASIPSGAC